MSQTARRLAVWFSIVVLLLLLPLVAMQFTDQVNWDWHDFAIMGGALCSVGFAYELVARRMAERLKVEDTAYRVACGVGLVTAFLLFWVNGAVGIIGSENQSANLLYGAVFAIGLVGSVVARFRPRGMARTLLAAALAQLAIPVIALIVWPGVSWGGARMGGVFVFNAFFAVLFATSGLLFRRVAQAAGPGRQAATRVAS